MSSGCRRSIVMIAAIEVVTISTSNPCSVRMERARSASSGWSSTTRTREAMRSSASGAGAGDEPATRATAGIAGRGPLEIDAAEGGKGRQPGQHVAEFVQERCRVLVAQGTRELPDLLDHPPERRVAPSPGIPVDVRAAQDVLQLGEVHRKSLYGARRP